MNDFDWGINIGRFFMSFIVNDDFCGVAIRIGKEIAIDEEIEDRKVGKWIQTRKPSGFIGHKCSNCGSFYPFVLGLNYCPNCGTEMRGVENENN